MSKKNLLFCILINMLFMSMAFAQLPNADTVVIKNGQVWSINRIEHELGTHSRLYNGPEYVFYPFKSELSAYFNDIATFEPGTVVYDGYTYEKIPLLFDLYADVVISILPNGYSKFSLLSERVSEFYQNDHHFVRITSDSTSTDHSMKTGFYDLIYDKKIKIFIKRYKVIKETIDSHEYRKYFVYDEDYYMLKDRIYYKVNTERAFLAVFQKNRKEMQHYLKSKNISYRKTPELALKALAGYYDSLSN